jgi:hypothetical protein
MIRLQPEIIVTRLSTTMMVSSSERVSELEHVTATSSDNQLIQTSNSNSNDLVTQYYSHWATSPSWLKLLFGSLKYHRRNGKRRGKYYELIRARYKLPKLFFSKVWDIAGYRSLSDWSVNMRTYRIVPYDAPIFAAIRAGDIVRVQELLASQQAFVTDRDGFGCTPLHVSIFSDPVIYCLIRQIFQVCSAV